MKRCRFAFKVLTQTPKFGLVFVLVFIFDAPAFSAAKRA